MGKLPYRIYGAITLGTMFIVQAAVTLVTAGLAEQLFRLGWTPFLWSVVILVLCVVVLLLGKYRGLDLMMKIIVSLLTLATLIAVVMAFGAESTTSVQKVSSTHLWTTASIGFMIAFMGWMPIPLDASVWHSIWTKEKAEQTGQHLTPKGAFTDFNVGYLSAAFIGLLFFLLGILVMFGSGVTFSDSSVQFSAQLIDLYAQTLGDWSKPLISIAAFIAMFSTVITVTDAYPRVFAEFYFSDESISISKKLKWSIYSWALCIIPLFSLGILYFLSGSFKLLIDFAAGLSFLSAPFLAWFNYRLITGNQMPVAFRPNKSYRLFSLGCFVLLVAFCGVYMWYYFLA